MVVVLGMQSASAHCVSLTYLTSVFAQQICSDTPQGVADALVKALAGSDSRYFVDRAALDAASSSGWGVVPEGAQAALIAPIGPPAIDASQAPSGVLMILCDRPRALSQKDQAWTRAVAVKLRQALA